MSSSKKRKQSSVKIVLRLQLDKLPSPEEYDRLFAELCQLEIETEEIKKQVPNKRKYKLNTEDRPDIQRILDREKNSRRKRPN